MWQLIGLSIIQSIMLAFGQYLLKVGLDRLPKFKFSVDYLIQFALDWPLLGSGIICGSATVLYMYILRKYPLNMAYPMASMSYVFALIFALCFLNETISWNRWLGIAFIMIGCIFVAR